MSRLPPLISEKTVKLDPKRFNWFTIFAGVMVLIFAASLGWIQFDFYLHSTVTVGEVTKLNAGGYHPRVTFTTDKGEQVSFPGSSSHAVEVGDRVEVRYMRTQPLGTAQINQAANLIDFMPAVVGIALVIAGLMGKSLSRIKMNEHDVSNK